MYKGGKMNIEDREFEKHCSDNYFFCPLCEEHHEKTLTNKGDYKAIWWCQMPIEDKNDNN